MKKLSLKLSLIIAITLLITGNAFCVILYNDDQQISIKSINSIRLERIGYRYLLSEDQRLTEYAQEKLQQIIKTGNLNVKSEEIEKDLKERGINCYMATAVVTKIGVVNIITIENAFKELLKYLIERASPDDPLSSPLLYPGYTHMGVSLGISVEKKNDNYITTYVILIILASEIGKINTKCIMGKNLPSFIEIHDKNGSLININTFADGTFFAELSKEGWYTFEFKDPDSGQTVWHYKVYINRPEVIEFP